MSGAVMLFCFINVGSKETYEKADSPQTMRNPPPDLHLLLAVFLPIVSLAAGQGPVLPLENSPIVSKSADGSLVVADKFGAPVTGLKLSQYDALIDSPNLAVTSDGVIHLAFIERQAISPYNLFVFHRQSADGGKTWSDPKDLSEDMPNFGIDHCRLIVDSQDRVYIIWRTGESEGLAPGNYYGNLVYRVLNHGKWSKIIPIHPPGTSSSQNIGSLFYFAGVDASGHAQVAWNTCPDTFHSNEVTGGGLHLAGIGNGLVFQASLDGSTPPQPKQVFMTPITVDPNNKVYGKKCDDLSSLDGYFDASGAPRFIAIDQPVPTPYNDARYALIEDGKITPAVTLPGNYMYVWLNPPRLLLDSQGRRHVIALYGAGEHPNFRDYTLGSDDEPTVILSAKGLKGTCMGFQAYQGPSGHMAVVMQTTDAGFNDAGDTWISVSDGGAWSPPVCVTANAARATWVAKNKGRLLNVATGDHYGPGPGAVAFDKDGHLLLALINVKTGSFGLALGGVTYASGSSASPMLFFYKF